MAFLAILSLGRGRSAGIAAAAGVALGLAVLGAAAGLGLGTLIAEMRWLYEALRWGGVLFLLYLGALGYYLFVRITQTLGLKPVFLWYGILTLMVECLGAVSVTVYGINHLW